MDCPICTWTPADVQYIFLYETACWRVCLAPNQSLVGRCVIALKRHAGDLADLTSEEVLDFWDVIRRVEQALRRAFDTTLFNWSCYMNLAYRENSPTPHVHWWAVPRYNHPVTIGGTVFEDPQFGSPYDHSCWQEITPEIRAELVKRITAAL